VSGYGGGKLSSNLIKFQVDSNGFTIDAEYDKETVEVVLSEIMDRIHQEYTQRGARTTIFLAAPGGTGKTTLSKIIERMFNERYPESLIAAGIDGFHYKNSYLDTHYVDIPEGKIPLRRMKGFYNTYDTSLLGRKIQSFVSCTGERWPVYSRILHDPVDDSIEMNADILLLEGNWLLDSDPRWSKLRDFCNLSIFIEPPAEMLRSRLIERKVRGGLSLEEAEEFYRNSDSKGVQRVLDSHVDADINLILDETGHKLTLR